MAPVFDTIEYLNMMKIYVKAEEFTKSLEISTINEHLTNKEIASKRMIGKTKCILSKTRKDRSNIRNISCNNH